MLQFDEFLGLMVKQLSHDQSAEDDKNLREAFKVFDKDNDGFIDKHELKAVMAQVRKTFPFWVPAETE